MRYFIVSSLFVLALSFPAHADPRLGSIVVCNTQAQVERLAALSLDNAPIVAFQKVNDENADPANPQTIACAAGVMLFEEEDTIHSVKAAVGFVDVVRVTVLGWAIEGHMVVLPARTQFSLFWRKTEAS